mmetsp:Transcript_25757/g.47072  ORF Transcript_25757/g.47072 Transcript_25757/m.47072 type:complete len:275 (-) Transcript_25757:5-829(-)
MDDDPSYGVKRSVEIEEKETTEGAVPRKLRKRDHEITADEEGPDSTLKGNRQDLEDSDPLYTLIGELGDVQIVLDDATVNEEPLLAFVQRLMHRGPSKRSKDWVAVWAAMRIPVESQAAVLKIVIGYALSCQDDVDLGGILAALVREHRAKSKAVEQAVQEIYKDKEDEKWYLVEMLKALFPKSPTTSWGWSRIGWSWNMWWTCAKNCVSTMSSQGSFDCLAELLNRIEHESGKPLTEHDIWESARRTAVRETLLQYGLAEETELDACLDAHLA